MSRLQEIEAERDMAQKRADQAEYLALFFAAVCIVECLIIAVLI